MLTLKGINKQFGGLRAVSDVSFHLDPNQITALIGPNGAGKTTLFNTITGTYPPTSGEIWFKGQALHKLAPHQICRMGIARTFQNLQLFSRMTVLENVLVGLYTRTRTGFFIGGLGLPRAKQEEKEAKEEAYHLLGTFGLAPYANHLAGSLPFGKQRLLEIARALASQPVLILLDEPAAGLNSSEAMSLGESIKQILSRGVTVFLVEHNMSLVMGFSDRVIVLNYGKLIYDGSPYQAQNNEEVIEAYLGKGRASLARN